MTQAVEQRVLGLEPEGDAAGATVSSLPASTANGRLTVAATDHTAQEDARRLRFSGGPPAGRAVLQSDAPVDLSRERNSDAMLVFTVRVDSAPDAPVMLGAACGAGCTGRIDVSEALRTAPPGKWTRIGVPLKCFGGAGADLAKLTGLFEVSAGALDLSVSRVALDREHDQVIACPAP